MIPEPNTAHIFPLSDSASRPAIFLAKCVIDQNKNMIVAPELNADRKFTIKGTCDGSTNAENKRAIIMNNGAPGGWPTSNL